MSLFALLAASIGLIDLSHQAAAAEPFTLEWQSNILTVRRPLGAGTGAAVPSDRLPGGQIDILYIEAYCRPGSTDRDWGRTTIGHKTEVIGGAQRSSHLQLRCTLKDGVTVDHDIRGLSSGAGVEFRLTAHNPTNRESEAAWAQPCLRVDKFTGRTQQTYLDKCFIFVDGKLARLPTKPWATKARYTPGQVWAPQNVDRNDVNPRPLSRIVPSNGLIGCFSADEKMILATAWEPYQELFQGVITCVHSDFRIGGLKPGETKKIRGMLYVVPADIEGSGLLSRYAHDFPEQVAPQRKAVSD